MSKPPSSRGYDQAMRIGHTLAHVFGRAKDGCAVMALPVQCPLHACTCTAQSPILHGMSKQQARIHSPGVSVNTAVRLSPAALSLMQLQASSPFCACSFYITLANACLPCDAGNGARSLEQSIPASRWKLSMAGRGTAASQAALSAATLSAMGCRERTDRAIATPRAPKSSPRPASCSCRTQAFAGMPAAGTSICNPLGS